MKQFNLTALFLLCITTSWSQQLQMSWQKTMGSDAADFLQKVIPTLDGGYIAAGYSEGGSSGEKTENSRGFHDWWIVKLDASKNIVWERTIGGDNDDYLGDIIPTSDSGFLIAGASKSDVSGEKKEPIRIADGLDIWLMKLDKNGTTVWQKAYGGDGWSGFGLSALDFISLSMKEIIPVHIKEAPDGGYILATASSAGISGEKTDTNRLNLDPLSPYYPILKVISTDCWILKLDDTGGIQWQKTIGGDLIDAPMSIYPDPNGGYIIGAFTCSNQHAEKSDTNRTGVIGLVEILTGSAFYDYWVIKIDNVGNVVWEKTYGGDSSEMLNAVIPLPQGGYIVTGSSYSPASDEKTQGARNNSYDYWVLKIDDNGSIEWQKTIGGDDMEYLYNTVVTRDSGILLSGITFSEISGDRQDTLKGFSDYWMVKLDATGNIEWEKRYGGSNETEGEAAVDVHQLPNGDILVGGISSAANSGEKTEACRGDRDFWIFKLECSVNDSVTADDITLTSAQPGGQYQWIDCATGAFIPDATTQSFTPHQTGSYRLLITYKGCTDTSECFQVAVPETVRELDNASDIRLFPNPATDQLRITSTTPIDAVHIFNIVGSKAGTFPFDGSTEILLNISNLQSGIYLMQIQTKNGWISKKLEITE